MTETEALDAYIAAHTDPEPGYLHQLWRATNWATVHGRMSSGHVQGRLLRMLVQMIRPRRVLEVGTFSGYSALCMAEGLEDDTCRVYTYDVNDEMEDFTRQWIKGSPYGRRVCFHIGDAFREAPKLGIDFDLIFLDGDKRTYAEGYRTLLPLLREGGYLLADNTLWDGHVIDPAYDRDAQTQGIRRFNDLVAADPSVEKVIIPIRDGLTIIKKRKPLPLPLSKGRGE